MADVQVDVYSTFHSIGVTLDIDADDDANGNAVAQLSYRRDGASTFTQGMGLTRISPTRFVGSVFAATPGTEYELQIDLVDDGPLNGVGVTELTSTREPIVIPAAGQSLLVSPSGSGSACTNANPCALDQALMMASAGDEIVLLDGVYYVGDLRPPRSGTPGAPIVIRAAAGATPVLDGAVPSALNWTSVGGGVYRTAAPVPDIHLVLANARRLMSYRSLDDVQSLYFGVPGSFSDGTTLWVHLANNQNPAEADIAVSRHNSGFLVEQDHLYFIGLTFRHYGYGAFAKAIYLNNASDTVVRNCRFILNDSGVSLKRDSHRNVIEDNEFRDDLFEWPWEAIKDSERGDPITEAGAVEMFSPVTGRGNVIRRNVVHDVFDGMGSCPESTDGVVNETDVYDNRVFRAADDGLTTDGSCSNVRLWNNTVHTALVGISMAPSLIGPTYALRNLIYDIGAGNNDFPGTAFKFNSGFSQSGPMFILHNTADAVRANTSALEIKSPGSWSQLVAINNIWSGTDFALENVNTQQPVELRSNALYSSTPGRLVRWDGTNYADLATFQAATGQESMSLAAPPDFRDAGGADYTLAATSALRDAALVLPGINADYAGSGPDFGAFESEGSMLDGDNDGVPDAQDNCLSAINPAQLDTDDDGYGDVCDADFNNDCVVNALDLGLLRSAFFSSEPLFDLNGDGVINVIDLGLLRRAFFAQPGPGLGSCS